jgi:hypothetical protein
VKQYVKKFQAAPATLSNDLPGSTSMSHDIANRCHGDEWSSGEGCEGIWPGGP